jgi:hypothetical protein
LRAELEPQQKLRRKQRNVMAGGTIDLDEIATPEVLDPRQVKGLHSGRCSRNVLGALAGLVNRDHTLATSPAPGASRVYRREALSIHRARY